MKTLPSLIAICALGWALQLKFQEIPSLNSTIESLEEEAQDREESLSLFKFKNKEYQKKIDSLLDELSESKKIKPVEPATESAAATETPKDDYSSHNSAILSNITRLTDTKRLEKEKLDANVRQIEGYLANGKTLLNEHLKIKPEFKDGKIRTSDADRQKWFEQHKVRESFLKTEISKLEGQKENLTRAYNSFAAKIDLEVQQLEKEIKE